MSKLLEQLRERNKPTDLTCKSGNVWRVRRPVASDYWALYGGVPTLAKSNGDAPSSDQGEQKPAEQSDFPRRMFGALVLGLVDSETGGAEAVPYEDVPLQDALEVQRYLMALAPNTQEKTDLVGRSLHGSEVRGTPGHDGAAVGAATDNAA